MIDSFNSLERILKDYLELSKELRCYVGHTYSSSAIITSEEEKHVNG